MHIVVVGLNHKTAPVETREKLAIPQDRLPQALAEIKSLATVSECLVLCTCNRSEVYATTTASDAHHSIVDKLAEICTADTASFLPNLYVHRGHKAAEHLFRVASGIDSMVIGEQQILGQVREAFSIASREGATGPVLNALFRQAISVGKKARTETEICRGAFSVGSVAVQLARSIFENLDGRFVLVVGAGKMAELTITHLSSCGRTNLLVANRTKEKAEALVEKFGGIAVPFEELNLALEKADIVITSTGSEQPIFTHELVQSAMRARRGRPIFFIDIAVPRDVEKLVGNLDNVFVYDIDDLEQVVAKGRAARQVEIAKVEALVQQQVSEFMQWLRSLEAVPIINAIREKFENIGEIEIGKLRSKLPHLPAGDWDIIQAAIRSMVRKICHEPIIRAKHYSQSQDEAHKLEVLREIFGLQNSEEDDNA